MAEGGAARTGATVVVPCDVETSGYLAVPPGGGPGLVLIHEWWGLVDHITDVADRFAREGFVTLAPDLYDGTATQREDEARALKMALDVQRAGRRLSAAVSYLGRHEAVTGTRVGAVGFCFGGGLAVILAALEPERVGAAVTYYGTFQGAVPDLGGIRAPVLAHYAGADAYIAPDAGRKLKESIESRAGTQVELHEYPGMPHAFFNDTEPENYRPQEARLSWERTLRFLHANLQDRASHAGT